MSIADVLRSKKSCFFFIQFHCNIPLLIMDSDKLSRLIVASKDPPCRRCKNCKVTNYDRPNRTQIILQIDLCQLHQAPFMSSPAQPTNPTSPAAGPFRAKRSLSRSPTLSPTVPGATRRMAADRCGGRASTSSVTSYPIDQDPGAEVQQRTRPAADLNSLI